MKRKKANSAGIEMAAARAAQLAAAPPAEAVPVAPNGPPDAAAAVATGGSSAVKLPSNLTIRGVREFKKHVVAAWSGGDLEIDGREVSEVDTAGVQLLLAVRREVIGRGGQLSWIAPSELLRGAARALGLAQEMAIAEGA